MSDTLAQIIDAPGLGLIHRVRRNIEDGHKNVPCLVLLHGVGANEAGLVELARVIDPRILVVLARGPLVFGPGQFGWFQVAFTGGGPQINVQQAEDARRKLLAFIDALPQAYGVNPRRICVAGFSQGGIMSASVALTEPDKVGAFGILSGRILPEVRPLVSERDALKELHAFVSHGVQDQKLGVHFARDARAYLESLGVQLCYNEYDAGHELDSGMVRDFLTWTRERLCEGSECV